VSLSADNFGGETTGELARPCQGFHSTRNANTDVTHTFVCMSSKLAKDNKQNLISPENSFLSPVWEGFAPVYGTRYTISSAKSALTRQLCSRTALCKVPTVELNRCGPEKEVNVTIHNATQELRGSSR